MKAKKRERRMPSHGKAEIGKRGKLKSKRGKPSKRTAAVPKTRGPKIYTLRKRPAVIVPGAVEAAAVRRVKALELRIEGMTYAEIAKELGVVESVAWEYVNLELARIGTETAEKTEHLRAIELGRIEVRERKMTARERHWERLALRAMGDEQGELTAEWVLVNAEAISLGIRAESALCKLAEQRTKLAARRAELQGLDEPVKVEHSGAVSLDAFRARVAEVKRNAAGKS